MGSFDPYWHEWFQADPEAALAARAAEREARRGEVERQSRADCADCRFGLPHLGPIKHDGGVA